MSESSSFSPNNLWKIPGFRQLHRSGVANSLFRKQKTPYWGRYRSSEEAQSMVPPGRRASFDNEIMVSHNIEKFSTIHVFDWPVLFFLQKLIHENKLQVVTDFGGHIGVKFYAFRTMLDVPVNLTWQVVDVPAMVREGRRRLSPEMRALQFFERAEETAACDVLLCSGVMQYAEATIEEIVARLPEKPRWILLNKVSVFEREGFFTLEDHGRYSLPFHVFTPKELEESRLRLGYGRVAQWTIPHCDIVVHSSQGTDPVPMIGEAWALNEK
jgi:putative methyltransferase (TIGR04325 family)